MTVRVLITGALGALSMHCSPPAHTAAPEVAVASSAASSVALASSSPKPSVTPAASPGPRRVELEEHGLRMDCPEGWIIERGQGWVLMREPANAAALMLWGVRDALDSPTMLHLADEKLGAKMPVGLGKLTPVPSGLRFGVTAEDRALDDGTPARIISLLGASPKMQATPGSLPGTGVFGIIRQDASAEQREAVAAAIDSLAPL
jgi:hypothetical protein